MLYEQILIKILFLDLLPQEKRCNEKPSLYSKCSFLGGEKDEKKIPVHGLFMTVSEQGWVMSYSVWLSRVRKGRAGLLIYLLSPVTVTTWGFDIPKLISTQSSPMAPSSSHGAPVCLPSWVKCRFSVPFSHFFSLKANGTRALKRRVPARYREDLEQKLGCRAPKWGKQPT